MTDATQTPTADPLTPKTQGEFDAFLLLQGLIVVVLGGMGILFILKGEVDRAAEIGVGLVGALNLQRKPRAPQS